MSVKLNLGRRKEVFADKEQLSFGKLLILSLLRQIASSNYNSRLRGRRPSPCQFIEKSDLMKSYFGTLLAVWRENPHISSPTQLNLAISEGICRHTHCCTICE